MPPHSNYDKFPFVRVSESPAECAIGWSAIGELLRSPLQPGRFVLCVECYPGANCAPIPE